MLYKKVNHQLYVTCQWSKIIQLTQLALMKQSYQLFLMSNAL